RHIGMKPVAVERARLRSLLPMRQAALGIDVAEDEGADPRSGDSGDKALEPFGLDVGEDGAAGDEADTVEIACGDILEVETAALDSLIGGAGENAAEIGKPFLVIVAGDEARRAAAMGKPT